MKIIATCHRSLDDNEWVVMGMIRFEIDDKQEFQLPPLPLGYVWALEKEKSKEEQR